MHKIGFIGAGNMAFALAKAIKKNKLGRSIIASDVRRERLDFVKKELKINVTNDFILMFSFSVYFLITG